MSCSRNTCIAGNFFSSPHAAMAVENDAPRIDLLSYIFENTVDDQDKPVRSLYLTSDPAGMRLTSERC